MGHAGWTRVLRYRLPALGLLIAALTVTGQGPARAASPTLTHQASPSGSPPGMPMFDFATLSNGQNPTGTITFTLFGPDNATCSGPPIFTSTKSVAGNGNYQSDNFTPNAAGNYEFIASYSGDANNNPAATLCSDPQGLVGVGKKAANLSTQTSSLLANGTITDTASLSGGAGPAGPTGTMTFSLYGPNNLTCNPPTVFTSTKTVAGNGNYTSDPFTPTQSGTYVWIANYSGDSSNFPRTGVCTDPAETVAVSVGLVTPTLTSQASAGVAVGGQVADTATLSGGTNPTATITFTLYGPNDATCSAAAAFTTTRTVTGNGPYTSSPFTPTAAGTYRWRAAYSGDALNAAVSTACNDPNESVVVTGGGPITPTLTSQASPGVAVGGTVHDTATLAGGSSPTGTITFSLYGPNDATCAAAAAFTSTKTVTGNGGYTSDPFTPTAAGTYRWRAAYSGDAGNNAVATPCNDPNESVVVTGGGPVTPTLTSQASPGVAVGGTVHDTATLAGGSNPTGTITFTLYGPNDATCAAAAAFTSTKTVPGNGSYSSDSFTPTAAGTYRWRAAYSGDAGNNAVATPCNDPNESVVVTGGGPVTPTLTSQASPAVAVGGTVHDTATLAGGSSPTGTVTFSLYGPDDATCAAAAAFTSTKTVTGNGSYSSDSFTPTAAGTYRWRAAYSGDAGNNAVATPCNDPNESVVVSPAKPASIAVTDTPSPASQPEPGGLFTFSVVVTNTGGTNLTLTGLADSVYGNLATRPGSTCNTAPGTVLAPNATYGCQFTGSFTGNAGASQTDTVTATANPPTGAAVSGVGAATVTLTNVAPVVSVDKTASPTSLPAPGGPVTFTVAVHNGGAEPFTITVLNDDVYGPLTSRGTCNTGVGSSVAAGGTYSCQFTVSVNGAAGSSQTDTVTATVVDDDHSSASASDAATVTITAAPPQVAIDKTAAPVARPAPGGPFTFTVTVTNPGTVSETITSLTDNRYGNLAQQGTCTTSIGTVVVPGGSYACQFNVTFTGPAGSQETDTATVVVTSASGATATASDSATIAIVAQAAPMIVVDKSVSPASRPEPGGDFTFTVTVTNAGSNPVKVTALTDNVYGNLAGRGTCAVGASLAAAGGTYSCSFTATFTGNAGAAQTDTATATVTASDGQTATASDSVTISITDVPPSFTLANDASPASVPEPGGTVTHTLTVTNTGGEAVRITGVSDDRYGDLAALSGSTCGPLVGSTVAAGKSASCTFPASVSGAGNTAVTDTAKVAVVDDDGTAATATDPATVQITHAAPKVAVDQAYSPANLPEPGGSFTVNVTVRNVSDPETETVRSLVSDVDGDLNGRGSCRTGVVLPEAPDPASVYTCSYTATLTGNAGSFRLAHVIVTVADDQGATATAGSPDTEARLSVTDVLPTLTVTKTVSQPSVGAPGGPVVFTVTVSNTSPEAVVLASLTDDQFGNLDGAGTCRIGGGIAIGQAYQCSFGATVSGPAGSLRTDVVSAGVSDDEGNLALGRATATVAIAPVSTAVLPGVQSTPPGSGSSTGVAFTGADVERPARLAGVLVFVGFVLVGFTARRRRARLRPSGG